MMMTRRHLFGLGLAAGALPLTLRWARGDGTPLPAHPGVARRKLLVCLFQRGAVDGLSMVVPHGDPDYYAQRTSIAIARPADGGAVDLDGTFGLHPRLGALKPLWDSGALAVVHAVGSPSGSRSHFDAQDFMDSGTPDVAGTPDGWANRALGHLPHPGDATFRAVALGQSLPRALAGGVPSLVVDDLSRFGIVPRAKRPELRDRLTGAFERLYADQPGMIARTGREALAASARVRALPADSAPAAAYPKGPLGKHLMQIAQLHKADLGLELAFVDVGGWDTHANQGGADGQLARRLDELGGALAAFHADLGPLMADTVVLTMSEFGRTVAENGSGGTDHGHGTAMLVLGGPVRGRRVVGRWPGLGADARFEGRDLAVTTDFRDLFAEIVARHLGVKDLAAVFPGHQPAFPGVLA